MNSDSQHLHRLLKVMEVFRIVYSEMPAQTAVVFLLIALHEELSMAELAVHVGLSQSATSRNCGVLGDIAPNHKPGLGLVASAEDPNDRRRKIVRLTAKGRRVVAQLLAATAA